MNLEVSEMFQSLQGEGHSMGSRALFIRLSKCNLMSIGVQPGRSQPWVTISQGKGNPGRGSKKRLQELKPDDVIWAVDENNNLVETQVKAVFEYEIEDRIELTIDGVNHVIYCSFEHPWLTNRGWKKAEELQEGDELMHFSSQTLNVEKMRKYNPLYSALTVAKKVANTNWIEQGKSVAKSIMQRKQAGTYIPTMTCLREKDPERYQKICEEISFRMKDNNPMQNPEVVKKSQGMHQNINEYYPYMSKTEKEFAELAVEMHLPVEYTGRFSLPVQLGKKTCYPDFRIIGTNRLIELYWSNGRYSHRDGKWKKERQKVYEANGYSCTFVDFASLNKNDVKDLLRTDLPAQNGLKITKIRKFYYSPAHRREGIDYGTEKTRRTSTKMKAYDVSCYPYHTFIVDSIVTHNCGGFEGNLVGKDGCTWRCDSQLQMKTFTEYTPADLVSEIEKKFGEEYFNKILIGDVRIVVTGGEPALYAEPLAQFLEIMDKLSAVYQLQVLKVDKNQLRPPTYEVETNGTIFSGPQQFYERFSFVNCSPKLESSGMPKDKRIVPFALVEIAKHPYSSFKFVISKPEDWNEIRRDFIDTGYIQVHPTRIFLMPAGNTREELIETSQVVWKMAMETGCLATTRLQSWTWGPKPGI